MGRINDTDEQQTGIVVYQGPLGSNRTIDSNNIDYVPTFKKTDKYSGLSNQGK
jgi:hypothetical protein